jgi:hypothetical protein
MVLGIFEQDVASNVCSEVSFKIKNIYILNILNINRLIKY